MGAQVVAAYEQESAWRERIRAGCAALLECPGRGTGAGATVVVESLAAGPRALEPRASVLRVLIDAVDEGRAAMPQKATQPPPLTAEGVVGAVLSVIHTRLSETEARSP